MAKIQTEVLVVKFSKITKDNDKGTIKLPEDLAKTIEEVAQEMCGNDFVVEVETQESKRN